MMSKKFLGWMAAAVGVLFATACSNDEMLSASSDPYKSGEEVTVSFTISSEGKAPATNRAGEADETTTSGVHYPGTGEFAQISDGSKAKQLIYAVYDKDGNLLEQYGENDSNPSGGHYGQAIMDIETFPVTISLRLMRGETYNIAFWAQEVKAGSKENAAYDTNDLTMVEVKYTNADGSEALNNDESRDAFCKTETFTVAGDESRTVILRRPLAQINVGTAGYDYESAIAIANTGTDTPEAGDESTTATGFLYSKIELKGVAKYFDVLHNKALTKDDLTARNITDKEATQDVTYNWARIPAYVNYGDNELPTNYPSAEIPTVPTPAPTTVEAWNSYYRQFKEQFLRVKFYNYDEPQDNRPYLPYISKDETSTTTNPKEGVGFSPDTETFKYLSMCYVLVPDYTSEATGDSYKTTLESVTVWLNNKAEDTDAFKIGQNNVDDSPTVTQVPVQRNWRTNIFGKNLLTLDYMPNIIIDANFNGEYNKDGDKDWESDQDSSNYPKKGSDNGDPNE